MNGIRILKQSSKEILVSSCWNFKFAFGLVWHFGLALAAKVKYVSYLQEVGNYPYSV